MLGKELPAAYVNLNYVEDENCDTWGSEIGILEMRTRSSDKSFWASSADPYSGETSFAIAASNGALVLSVGEGRWMEQSGERYSDSPEVMAVDWLSSNVVMKGCKDGGVRLWDIRSRGEFRESRESCVQHPSQINHARRIDENTIVVAGLESQVRTALAGECPILLTAQAMYLRSAISICSRNLWSGNATIQPVSLLPKPRSRTSGERV